MNRWQFTEAFEGLTPRRRQVLKLLLAGVSDQDIAQSLHIETSTVRKHVENICSACQLVLNPGIKRMKKLP
ncbi:response regulator transcription factor [Coleofasciculus sp. F4-SAH-05]|uniref:response regulator transcription factor n=1 Tax=Coleofasciculus sp. F4-SAH-05 TaxID=3069525 RepID=UPI0032FD66FD